MARAGPAPRGRYYAENAQRHLADEEVRTDAKRSGKAVMPWNFPEKNRGPILASSLLVVEGRLEKYDGVVSVKADRFWGLHEALADHVQSRDFR